MSVELNCQVCRGTIADSPGKKKSVRKMIALYLTMVVVSTLAIFLLEHSTLTNAFRTALVAAIGKTIAANWVTAAFE